MTAKTRLFPHIHRQRFERAAQHYLRKCYKAHSVVRASEFAADLGLTTEYVSGLAAEVLGMPLLDFLRARQVAYAAHLLETSPLNVAEVAVRAGFGTAATLYRWFVAAHGMTPAAFRQLKK